MRSSSDIPCLSNGAGLLGKAALDERARLARHWVVPAFSSIGQTGSTTYTIKNIVKPVFDTCATALMGFPSTTISTKLGAEATS